jgi:hypothetical protein
MHARTRWLGHLPHRALRRRFDARVGAGTQIWSSLNAAIVSGIKPGVTEQRPHPQLAHKTAHHVAKARCCMGSASGSRDPLNKRAQRNRRLRCRTVNGGFPVRNSGMKADRLSDDSRAHAWTRPAMTSTWRLSTVIIPRRSITGRLVRGQAWRGHDGRHWLQ